MKSVLLFLFVFSLSSLSSGEIFKCVVDGKVIFADTPCGSKQERVVIKDHLTIQRESARKRREEIEKFAAEQERERLKWRLINDSDSMTGASKCVIKSHNIYFGVQNGDKLYASVNAYFLRESHKPTVYIKSETPPGKERPEIFHSRHRGVGIKVTNNDFIEVGSRPESYVFMFDESDSAKLFSQLLSAENFAIRLRYWPFPETVDGYQVHTKNLAESYKKFKETCN